MAIVFIRSTTAPTSPLSTSTPASNSGCKTSARFRKLRRCSPTASFTSAPRMESSSFSKPSATGCEDSRSRINSAPKRCLKQSLLRRRSQTAASICRQRLESLRHRKENQRALPASDRRSKVCLNPNRPATHVQVVPTELILKPGDKVNFRVRLFDAQGNFIREEPVGHLVARSIERHSRKRPIRRRGRCDRAGRIGESNGRRRHRLGQRTRLSAAALEREL